MTRSGSALVLALAFVISACDDTGPTIQAHGKARFLNGATPRATGAGVSLAAGAPPSNGQWLLSPDKITLRLKRIMLSKVGSTNGGRMLDVDCLVTYDKSQPGLTQLAECPFLLDTGTYDEVSLTFAGTYDLYINDAMRGFFTTSTGIVTAPPAGGAQPWTFTPPGASQGEFGSSPFRLPTPVIVADSLSPVTLNVVINGLQYFWANVNAGTVTTSGTTYPQRPDLVATVGTLAAVEFYSRSDIGTAESYCAFQCATGGVSQGVMSTSLYYSSPTTPSMVNLSYNGSPGNCTIGGPTIGFMGNTAKSYIGLDASGNVGWAVPTDETYGTYRAVMRLTRLSTIGSSTSVYCKSVTADPAPAGGSFASGAPAINQAANSIGTYLLMGK